MASKVFNKFGAKRSQNLADLPDKKGALNNILDRLASGSEIFTWEDLEILRNISISNVTTETIEKAADVTVKLTVDGLNLPYNPLVTLENRLDKAYFTTSQPFFIGGDGLTTNYYDTDAIQRETDGDLDSNFLGFDATKLVKQDNFWERGNFLFDNKISPEFFSTNGGVVWEGYYKPSIEEFHVGFEYEEKLQTKDKWIKRTLEDVDDFKRMEVNTADSHRRVKYLDREDIESLGFIKIEEPQALSSERCYRQDHLIIRHAINLEDHPGWCKIGSRNTVRDGSGDYRGFTDYFKGVIKKELHKENKDFLRFSPQSVSGK